MNLQLTNRIQNADHWEVLQLMSEALFNTSDALNGFRDTFDEISEKREATAMYLARVEVIKGIIRMKLNITDDEFAALVANSEVEMEAEIFKEEEVVQEVQSLSSLI